MMSYSKWMARKNQRLKILSLTNYIHEVIFRRSHDEHGTWGLLVSWGLIPKPDIISDISSHCPEDGIQPLMSGFPCHHYFFLIFLKCNSCSSQVQMKRPFFSLNMLLTRVLTTRSITPDCKGIKGYAHHGVINFSHSHVPRSFCKATRCSWITQPLM